MTRYLNWLMLTLLALTTTNASAHKASDGFIYLDQSNPTASTVRVDLALRDLSLALPMDSNGDGQLTGAEVKAARAAVTGFVESGLDLRSDAGACILKGTQWGLARHSDGPYAATRYDIHCPGDAPATAMNYNLLFDLDPLHRGLVQRTTVSGESLAVMGPDQRRLDLAAPPSGFETFASFLYEGVVHLLIGLDHILFLLVLILPATYLQRRQRESAAETGRAGFRARLWQLTGIVTAFTVAHSITLALAALDIVQLPIAWVEMVIALSILVAAMNVVWPILGHKTWKLAFGFGLIHGFGFASVLGDLTSGVSQTVTALAGFNIGVELGQLGLLIMVFPLLFVLGKYRVYARAGVPAMILAVSCISIYWVTERAGQLY
ncbi:HupE/UreJ family protein [Marinobacter lacisalsi]|uniref:HupE/UreJ family protein n=1 Tax=Marinobacter lacisalsi TaxID=475979 RepID=A0ABV8QD73_9GAMM